MRRATDSAIEELIALKRGARQRTASWTCAIAASARTATRGDTGVNAALRELQAVAKTRRDRLQRQLSEEPCPAAADVVADPSRHRDRCPARFPGRALQDCPPAPRPADAAAGCALPGYRALRPVLRPYRPEIRYSCVACDLRPRSATRRQLRPADCPDVSAWHCPLIEVASSRDLLSQASCQEVASRARHRAGVLATFLQTICRLLQSGLQLVPPRKLRMSSLSSESDAGTRLATDRAQGVGNIGFVQPSHEPSSIHPAHLLHPLAGDIAAIAWAAARARA